jgi:hypothetical protein
MPKQARRMPEPLLRFVVGGVQKGGTTAIAEALARHPAIAMPNGKELHAFDAEDFDDGWDSAQVDARIAPEFGADRGQLHGDATPLSIYHPGVVRRIARYNPAMRWIVLLRDPVERAISHYYMELRRGKERRGLFAAVLAEPSRLHRAPIGFAPDAAWRWASYVDRGRYARQLDVLHAHFPRSQVLLLRSVDLLADPVSTLGRVTRFLGVSPVPAMAGRAFVGDYAAPSPLAPGRLLLRWRLRGEIDRLREHHGIDLRADS